MPDITMNVDDTLELDTIIENSSRAKEPITVTDGTDYNLSGFQTHTGVFDPQSSGSYTLDINGQELTIKVNEENAIPENGISRWTLDDDDTDNGNIIDVWNGYNGSIDGATTGIQGPTVTYDAGEAYSFDGDNDKVTLPTFSESKWSIAAWSYWPESSSKHDASIGWGSTDGGGGESRIQFRSDRIRTYVNGSSYIPTFTEELDTWKFYTLTCDGSGYTYYIDGSKYDDSNLSTNLSEFDNHEIGKVSFKDNVGTKGNYTKCDVSDYRIYKKSLTPTEVSNLYTTGSI